MSSQLLGGKNEQEIGGEIIHGRLSGLHSFVLSNLYATNIRKPWQQELQPRDYVFRSGPEFYIFSEILPDPEPRAKGLEHYRFTRSYSVACVSGELGDIHVSTVEGLLTTEEFETAKSKGWNYVPYRSESS